jgi:hypothetical protein
VLSVCVAALLAPACASTGDEAAVQEPAPAQPVTARALAASLGLPTPRRSADGAVYLQSGHEARIALFPGTHTATVRGQRYRTEERLLEQDDTVWIAAHDADMLRAMWQQGVRAGAAPSAVGSFHGSDASSDGGSTGTRLTLDDLPPRPDSGSARPPAAPATAFDAPTPAERRAWTVPLRRPWQYIVVHHSATPAGNAAAFHEAHRAKGWDGLGYHFVIGNGRKSPDGKVEVGFRWKRQREGAHAGNDLMNQRGIGICLVGNFDKGPPTAAQMRSLRRLCDFLSAYCEIPASGLRLHKDFRDTACPGRHFPRSFALKPPASVRGAAHAGHRHDDLPR